MRGYLWVTFIIIVLMVAYVALVPVAASIEAGKALSGVGPF
jgi:hypothetical protein